MRQRPWLVFAIILCWKVALLVFSGQPIPANDSFFYDGAVVHKLLHGGYYNPTLSLAFPISGGEVFSAYPPVYQALLFLWMSVFGTSVLAAMWLHMVLFAAYGLVLLAIFRELRTPAWCVNLACAFLLLITFHDRPDSAAHVFGMLAVYSWIRATRALGASYNPQQAKNWGWLMVACVVLCLCTSMQIGGMYYLWMMAGGAVAFWIGREPLHLLRLTVMSVVPVLLVAVVAIGFPKLWAGFREHAHQTPSITGLRIPHWQELAKIARTTPGLLGVALLVFVSWFKQSKDIETPEGTRQELVLVSLMPPALMILGACTFLLTPNTVAAANYLQPVAVGCYLAFCAQAFMGRRWLRLQLAFFGLAVLVGSVRAIGMTAWGVACARDVSEAAAIQCVGRELDAQPVGTKVVLSSAYLYEALRHTNVSAIHSDWLSEARADVPNTDPGALLTVMPAEIIVTQFDYYRRYQEMLAQARKDPRLADVEVVDLARTPPPDSIKSMQQVVQHISWAPVVIKLKWKQGGA